MVRHAVRHRRQRLQAPDVHFATIEVLERNSGAKRTRRGAARRADADVILITSDISSGAAGMDDSRAEHSSMRDR